MHQILDFMKKYITLLAASLLLGACGDDNSEPTPEPKQDAERTVLVYIAAENNLSKISKNFADNDLKEMKEGSKKLNDRQNLIIYVDKAEKTPPYIARIKDGVLVDSTSMDETLTADPAILEKMLRYTREKYPAKSYGLVLWGHADGWLVHHDSVAYAKTRSYGGDTGDNSSSGSGNYWMNIPSMARAITNAMGSERLRFIFADCCNFLCVESAYELRNVTDYLIGSPAEIPDPGAPYQLVVPNLFDTSETFYKAIIDAYYDYYIDYIKENPSYIYNLDYGDLEGNSVPLAAVKSSELENLAQATNSLLSTISSKLSTDGDFTFNRVIYYGYAKSNKYAYDIYDALKKNTAENDFSVWEPYLVKAVPYSRQSAKWLTGFTQLMVDMNVFSAMSKDNYRQLSMFFPRQIYKSTNPNWNTTIRNFQWNDVIRWEQYGW